MKKNLKTLSVLTISLIFLLTSCVPTSEESGNTEDSFDSLFYGVGFVLIIGALLTNPAFQSPSESYTPPNQTSSPPPVPSTNQPTQTTTSQLPQITAESEQAESEIDALLNNLSSTNDVATQEVQSSATATQPTQTQTQTTVQAVQPTAALSISTSSSSYQPFEHIEIDVPNLDSSSDYWVEIKPNATGGWDNNSIISYPAITTRTNKINANAIPAAVLSNSDSYELRIRQGSDTYSNPVRIQEVLPQIPASQAGRATATLDIVQNLMREASSDNSYLPQMSLSSVYQSSQDLGIDPLAIDQLSESILTEITDGAISTVSDDGSSLTAMQEVDDLIEQCLDDLENSTPIEEGYEYVFYCYEEVSDEVLEDEQLMDEMSELYDENIGLGRASASMLEYIAEQDLVDGDLENLLAASLISEAGTQSLEIAEDLPEDFDSDDPEYLAERENEEDTFEDISEDIEEFQDYVEQDIDYEDLAEGFDDPNQLDGLKNLESNTIDTIESLLKSKTEQLPTFSNDLSDLISVQYIEDGSFILSGNHQDIGIWIDSAPEDFSSFSSSEKQYSKSCNQDINNEYRVVFPRSNKFVDFDRTGGPFTDDNFLYCKEAIYAFNDTDFFNNVYGPLLLKIEDMKKKHFAEFSYAVDHTKKDWTCGNDCSQIFAAWREIELVGLELMEKIREFNKNINFETKSSTELSCESSYIQFQSSKEDILTCVHSSLVLENANANQAGSYIPSERGLDVGSSNVRITYSRDFIKGGECIQGYEKVFFLEKNRCRWTGLTLDEVVAYTINTSTQEQEVVIR